MLIFFGQKEENSVVRGEDGAGVACAVSQTSPYFFLASGLMFKFFFNTPNQVPIGQHAQLVSTRSNVPH
jgi:hypothetical protein